MGRWEGWTVTILYLSRYIIRNKAEYYRLLLDVTRNQVWEPWILYVLHGVEDTARWTTAKIATIRQAASRYLKQLVEIGVLEERAVGREKLFIHPKLMHLLTRDDNAVFSY